MQVLSTRISSISQFIHFLKFDPLDLIRPIKFLHFHSPDVDSKHQKIQPNPINQPVLMEKTINKFLLFFVLQIYLLYKHEKKVKFVIFFVLYY